MIRVGYCRIVDFWRSQVALLFHTYCVSALGLAHLWPSHWVEALVTYILSVEILSVFREDWVVDSVEVQFLTTGLDGGSLTKHLFTCSRHQAKYPAPLQKKSS
jgi:hypothetical protein